MITLKGEFELRKFVAPEFVFGSGARFLAGRYARNFGARKVLIVTDPGVTASGWTNDIIQVLDDEKLEYEIYSDVKPNPCVEEVMKGAEIYLNTDCNVIIAVGGGSPMDCAKGIGIVSSNNKHIREFEGVDKVSIPAPPLICVPTTAGSSADVSQFAIISDRQQNVKVAMISKNVVPDVALIDPVTTTTMSSHRTVCTGFDTLSHAMESFVSNASSPITDLHSKEAIRLVTSNLKPTLDDPKNLHFRSELMLASLNAGLAFSNASLGLVHAMAHSLGGLLDLSHGECNALLLEHVIEFNFSKEPERYQQIGEAMGLRLYGFTLEQKKSQLITEIKLLKKSTGIDRTLKQVGVREKDIPKLAENAMNDPCIVTNPRRPNKEDVEEIFKNAL